MLVSRTAQLTLAASCVSFLAAALVQAQPSVLRLEVTDTEDRPVAGVVLSPRGYGGTSAPSGRDGRTRLSLVGVVPGGSVLLRVVPGEAGWVDWVFIDPWNGRVRMPPADRGPESYESVVVLRRSDRQLLESGEALAAITATILEELGRQTSPGRKLTAEDWEAVLVEVAAGYGLPPDEIDQALRAWGETAEDPYERGLSALYEENYPVASAELSKSLAEQKQELKGARLRIADTAFFLGQALYGEGRRKRRRPTWRPVYGVIGEKRP